MGITLNPFTGQLDITGTTVGNTVIPYANFAAFPAVTTANNGQFAVALDTGIVYEVIAGSFVKVAGPGNVLGVGTIDSATPSTDGAVIHLDELIMQSASATDPGLVNNTTQSFSGNKTLTGTISASNLSGTNTGDQTIALTGGVTGSGTGSFAATVVTNANLTGPITSIGNTTSVAAQTGTGSTFVMDTSPTLVTPNLGTPSALVGTNITGTATSFTASNVTTNANLTGEVTSVGNTSTVSNAVVIAKVLTGYVSGAGTVSAADSILTAIEKLNGNTGNYLPLAGGTMSGNIAMGGDKITGLASGTVSGDALQFGQIGAASGIAPLDSSSKIPASYLPSVVMEYQQSWNPNTNSPTLVDGTGTNGFVYRVSTADASTVVGLTDPSMVNFNIGDLIIYSGALATWQKAPAVDGVSSVNSAVGAVTVNAINQLTGDVTAGPASGSQSEAATVAKIQGTVVSGTTGTGNVVFSNSPTLVTPALGTPSALIGTNITGTATSFTASNVTTNANLTGDVTSIGNATTLATVNSNVGSFGSSTSIPSFTVNGKGLITAASGNVVIAPAGTLSGTTLNSTVVSSSLTSVGTITAGTWNGTTIATANGGTGNTTGTATINANLTGDVTSVGNATTYNNIVPVTTGGTGLATLTANNVILGNGTSTPTFVAPGTSGNVLTSNGTTWVSSGTPSPSAVAVYANGIIPTGTISGSPSVAIFGSVDLDTNSAYNTSTGLFTAPSAGYYAFSCVIDISFTASGIGAQSSVGFQLNGSTIYFRRFEEFPATTEDQFITSGLVKMAANDTLSVVVTCSATSPIYNNSFGGSAFQIHKVGS